MRRRDFLGRMVGGAVAGLASTCIGLEPSPSSQLNILLITGDDLNYNSTGVTGCAAPNITPNIDAFAAQGMRFEHAHVTVGVCQPCRSVLMTGRYAHRNGAMGFEPIDTSVPTLQESLHAAGYLNGIMAKVDHLEPAYKFCWDTSIPAATLAQGRDPGLYYSYAKAFFDQATAAGKPFFLMANSQDPHRPFAGSAGNSSPAPSHYYSTAEVEVPGFLPDIPNVRTEVAQYYSSVRRCDDTVGQVLRALDDAGCAGNTLVMFLGDNGMSFPFSKANCYLTSTKTAWIVRWPGRTGVGVLDNENLISGIDFMPTILDAAGLPTVPGMDGRSFVSLLDGGAQTGRDLVFTEFHKTVANISYPMRTVMTKRYGYIYNSWSNGTTIYQNESQQGLTWNAMVQEAQTNSAVAQRVQFFQRRVKDEFYDYQSDPNALVNLYSSPSLQTAIRSMQNALLARMRQTGDPLLAEFEQHLPPASAVKMPFLFT